MTNGNGESRTTLGANSKLTLAFMGTLIGAASWAGWSWRDNAATMAMIAKDNQAALVEMSLRIDNRFNALELKMLDRWTGTDMKLWVLRAQQENKDVHFPDPQHDR